MSEKKRKASVALENRQKKKHQTSTGPLSVKHIHGDAAQRPIIGTTPGVSFPQDVRFRSYSKRNDEGSQILLHSSEHPTIDYIAVEGTEPAESHVKHYIGVYDPATNKIQLTEAKHLSIRGSLRQAPKLVEDEVEEEIGLSHGTQSALTQAFGSKKSKKAVQAMAENRLLAQGVEGATIAEALSSNLKDEDEDIDDATQALALSLASKPIPMPNLTTTDISEVYSLSNLIHPRPASITLNYLNDSVQKLWRDRLKAGKEIKNIRSRFVANRVSYLGKHSIANPEDRKSLQQLHLLFYIETMIEIAHYVSKQARHSRLLFVDKWPEHTLSAGVPVSVVKQIVSKIFPETQPNERCMTLLRSTILALALHVLPPSGNTGAAQLVVEPTDLQLDLAMEADEVRKLYRELGCSVKPASEKELNMWGWTKLLKKTTKSKDGDKKKAAPKAVFAVLKFPLDFPKVSSGRRAGARR